MSISRLLGLCWLVMLFAGRDWSVMPTIRTKNSQFPARRLLAAVTRDGALSRTTHSAKLVLSRSISYSVKSGSMVRLRSALAVFSVSCTLTLSAATRIDDPRPSSPTSIAD
jgi:hypothetical protein